ncbi:MAG: hypothetical protein JWO06_614 [Bacteroidota bacterium]|nr:hypothetical protein [Bacteroidota bacterium]
MKKILIISALLIAGLDGAMAQSSTELAANTTVKSQQQIMDEFNSRSNVSLKYYPNPAVNFLMIEPLMISEAGVIKIMDITGVLQAEIHLEPGSNGLTVDLTQYKPGLYVLAYYNDSNHLLHIGRFYKN